MIIVIDPGHGGITEVGGSSPNNATGPTGLQEKTLTLDLALRLSDGLRNTRHQVILTRTTDVNLGLADRARMARESQAKVFLSIHFNGDGDRTTQGTETFLHPNGSAASRVLSQCVQSRLVNANRLRNRGVKTGDYAVLRPVYHLQLTAACLAEISFLTNELEETRLKTDAYRKVLADALRDAILDFEIQAAIDIQDEHGEGYQDAIEMNLMRGVTSDPL